jgi:hypothetical protein
VLFKTLWQPIAYWYGVANLYFHMKNWKIKYLIFFKKKYA